MSPAKLINLFLVSGMFCFLLQTNAGNPNQFTYGAPVRESVLEIRTEEPKKSSQASVLNAAPDSSRFTHMMLAQGLDEPMGMAILPDYNVVIVERKGAVKFYNAKKKQIKTISQFDVYSGIEDGLLGVTVDPDFSQNHWIYFYYGLAGDKNVSQLTRFELNGEQLNIGSKKVLLEVGTQRTYCCHSAGYLTFDADGFLYLSTGDNTNAEEIEGHNPTDERPGRQLSDDQGTTANSNDLRGKILRIKPLPDGTYTIPDGNLFPKDGSQGRPEVFVMGCRNPFRVSIDPKTKYVYWGDVGPDTMIPAEEGMLSYDEINQARKPGFFGYPYFLGNNEGFPKYDFATKKEGPKQDPLHPVNNSPNNTGTKQLPPAQPAMIWYGKAPSKRWPLVGKGAASAMAGPVYYSDLYPDSKYKLPEYYNGKLFIYEWIRKWIMAVTLDKDGNYVSMEPFLPHLKVMAPMDMQIARDGAIYLLAYGTNWFAKSADAGLIRVEYSEGNRNPIAVIETDRTYAAAPSTVSFSAAKSMDYDAGDKLRYEWQIGTKKIQGRELRHTFSKAGVYDVALTVTDDHGGSGVSTTQIKIGNTPPEVKISSNSNKSFYWGSGKLDYKISVSDAEDKKINIANVSSSFDYLTSRSDLASALSGATHGDIKYASSEKLYLSLDCKTCHTMDSKSIGPALKAVSTKYSAKDGSEKMLSQKIRKGGSGNWGTYPMPPHPDLSEKDADALAEYILSLSKQKKQLPLAGELKLTAHEGSGNEGAYVLQAGYTDMGANGIEPLKSSSYIVLRNPLVQIEDYEEGNVSVGIGTLNTGFVTYVPGGNGKYVSFKKIDLSLIKKIKFRVQPDGHGGVVEIHQRSKEGVILGTLTVPAGKITDPKSGWVELVTDIKPVSGYQDLYFVFKNPDLTKRALFNIDWLYFER
jgi:cytochrome c